MLKRLLAATATVAAALVVSGALSAPAAHATGDTQVAGLYVPSADPPYPPYDEDDD
ncbi:hypothetical protein ACWGH8_19825 [Nonomuraea muscovyensis]|jgi:hypothetical protein|uniref:Uncharacterized protein n=1 Tax=Nonomuraea muscovyensis TaxID=1124761 RepID=A0A7X0C412_9ACTN|nr:hypothetical protein [Nonomuraea muscovyensis]MBB6348130.1 hypothetical protein [Nonomuraea muscovyensis]MDF2712263.1 hypothetical protein [Nonomuraea muscovyensis]